MPTVVVSPRFQVVIPREIREAMKLEAGEEVQLFRFRNRLERVSPRGIAAVRGFLEGIDRSFVRDPGFEGLPGFRYRSAKPARRLGAGTP